MMPVYVICRDRVSDLRELVAWLERAGQERIILLDNDSTYEPLLEYYRKTPHEVVYLGRNLGPRVLYVIEANLLPNEPYVYTDPDIIPIEDCPLDLIEYLWEVLERYPAQMKAGVGLYLDDVADDFPHLDWERELVKEERALEPGIYNSLIDTTLAVHRATCTRFQYEAIRTGYPYQARHMSWYKYTEESLTDEDRYYIDRADIRGVGSTWGAWMLEQRLR